MTNGGGPAYLTNERESELDRDNSLICPTEENGQTENIRKYLGTALSLMPK